MTNELLEAIDAGDVDKIQTTFNAIMATKIEENIESLKESKSLYGSIKNELTNNNQSVVTESMSKIEKSPSSGSAQNLIESKTYENPQFLRMKDIMSKIVK